jgi:MYXO-CTERM domain-containing protein
MSQDSVGLPEKLGPCGDEGGGTPTGIVTAFQSGQTITVTVSEAIFHPGHYRIALAADPSQLPPEPTVTVGSTPCGTASIESPAVFPVLADDVFDHTAPFSSPQSVQITLPAGMTCTKCTLQVIEFMSDHPLNIPGGCFYHHCADISIQSGPVDAGAPPQDAAAVDGSGAGEPASSGSCGCSVPGGGPATAGIGGLLLATGALLRRTRRTGRPRSSGA